MVDDLEERTARARRLVEVIERQREAAEQEGRHFTSIADDQFRAKASGTHSPMIVFQGWNG